MPHLINAYYTLQERTVVTFSIVEMKKPGSSRAAGGPVQGHPQPEVQSQDANLSPERERLRDSSKDDMTGKD